MNKRFLATLMLAIASMTVMSCASSLPASSSVPESSTTTSSEVVSSSEIPSSSEVVLSLITISGADDIEIDFDTPFNALTGVTAVGNNDVNYTSSIVLQSTSEAVNLTTGEVDTTDTGTHAIRYTVTVGTVIAQKWRNVVVLPPEIIEGSMLINPDFELGTAGWDDGSVVYIADGAEMTLSADAGAIKAEVVAGWNFFTPRFGQMNVPFELDTTYEITFDAKSSVEKTIVIQLGQVIGVAPWWIEFAPDTQKTIGIDWATYSLKFTHTLDNKLGGILFSLGAVGGSSINATMWFDNVTIEESIPDPDTTAPTFIGVSEERNVTVGSEYDPMAGVTAKDLVDGDVTSSIVVEIKDSTNTVVTEVDTSVPGIFTVTYTVEDEAGNVATTTTTITIVSMLFKATNLIANPSFEQALNETTPEWTHWNQDGYWSNPAPVVTYTLDTSAGTYSVAIVGGGDAAWAIQVVQDGVLTLEQGMTYRLSFDAYATVARSINVALGYGDPYVQYARQDGIALETTSGTHDFVFTVTQETHAVKLTFELGSQPGFADGTIVLEEVRLQEIDAEPIITNGDFSVLGWRGFFNDWSGSTGSFGIVNGEFKFDITNYVNIGEEWALQVIQDDKALGGPTETGVIELTPNATYTLGFDVYATEAMTVHPYIISSNDWVNLVDETDWAIAITTEKTHYEVSVTAGAVVHGNEILKFQFGDLASFSDVTKSIMFDNVTVKDSADAYLPSVYNSNMETVQGDHGFYSPVPENTMKLSSDGAVFTIETVGGQAFEPHYYYIIDAMEPGTYAVVLKITSTETRDLRFNIVLPDAGYASIIPGNMYDFNLVAGVPTTVVIPFTIANPITNVKVELDFGTLGGALISTPTIVTMENFLIYRDYNDA